MSSTSSIPASDTHGGPQPTSTPNSDQARGSSSSLYLFTFLATLFLLLMISCAIVLRSFVLRRRFRRRIEEALAAGILLPPGPGTRRRDFGEKPKFYDVWVTPGGDEWDNMMPVSGNSLPSEQPSTDKPFQGSARPSAEDHETPTPPTSPSRVRQFLRSPFTHRPNSSSPTRTPSSPAVGPESVSDEGRVQVSVLVSMPTPSGLESQNTDTQVIPDVVIGVVQVPYKLEVGQV